MKQKPPLMLDDPREAGLIQALDGFVDAEWYRARYPDILAGELPPLHHFIRYGIAERRDPNPYFDGAWYSEHYPDISASMMHPLLHYLQSGAAELRNPHPHFDAEWYVGQHPEAAGNPLLYHIRTGLAQGFPTEKPIHIADYLPSMAALPVMPRRVVVDVVVPVYRGLDETRNCLLSVLKNTGNPLGRLIIVDDHSPDKALSAWLRELAARRQIHLVRNTRNLGFVASVNRGMTEAGSHDVVLLNSDTEVPPGWLERLTVQAYASPRIATVSPFSNNATICGYPANEGGPPAFGLSVEALDEICRTVNAGRAVDVPTTVGFCMYIRRKALQEVGAFDAERFTLGYGEENDFCLRASERGWQHRLACDVFVYHKGSVSFGDRANKLSARAMSLIMERYPSYQRDIMRHVSLGEVTPFRFTVTASLFRQSGLPVVLMVAHGLGGGVRRHIENLVTRFSQTARFLLLEPTSRGTALSVPSLPNHPVLTLPADRIDDLLLVLRSMAVSRVNIHHLLGMDVQVRALIHGLGVPFDVTVHDYYAICPQINLLPWRHGLYCGEPDIADCNACIAQRTSHGARDIVTWRAERVWQFRQAARVLCPSNDVLARLQRHGLADRAVLAPFDAVQEGPWPCKTIPVSDGILRIAVLGTLVDHKGGRTVARVAELADPKTTAIHLIGHIDGQFSSEALKRMTVTGRYDEAQLDGLIETVAPHVIWFPGVWPETFSYTLSTAIETGVAIAATDIGAFSERLAQRPLTWLVDMATSPSQWLAIFEEIRQHVNKPYGGPRLRPAVTDYYAANYLRPRRAGHGRANDRKSPRISVVPERFDIGFPTPCAYIRLLQPLHHPKVAKGFDVRVETLDTIFEHDAEVIITQRFALPDVASADRLAKTARRTGATLVFDLDDDLLNIPRGHADGWVLRPRVKVVRRMLDLADEVWVSTPGLAARLSAVRPGAVVVPNGLDERIWQPHGQSKDNQPVRILCMGTTTHERDLALIEPALLRLKAEYGDRVAIDIVGMTNQNDLPPGLNRIGPPANAWRSYAGFVNWLTSVNPTWDIGLAPLLDTPFNLSKSPIKALDYAALGLAVLASDTPVYRNSLADGPAGQLVANTAGTWYAALTWLIRNPELRRSIAAGSRTAFLEHASLSSQAEARHATLSRLVGIRKTHAAA